MSSVQTVPPQAIATVNDVTTFEEAENRIRDVKTELQTLKGVRETLLKPLKSYALVLVLLATVTFLTYLQPPGTFDDRGLLRTGVSFIIFVVFCSMSFYFSVGGLILCLGCSLPQRDDPLLGNLSVNRNDDVLEWRRVVKLHEDSRDVEVNRLVQIILKFVAVTCLLVVSISLCVGAFAAAGFATTPPDLSGNRLVVVCTTSAGGAVIASCVLQLLSDVQSHAEREFAHLTNLKDKVFLLLKFVGFLFSVIAISMVPGLNLLTTFGTVDALQSSRLRTSNLFKVIGLDKLLDFYDEMKARATRRNAAQNPGVGNGNLTQTNAGPTVV